MRRVPRLAPIAALALLGAAPLGAQISFDFVAEPRFALPGISGAVDAVVADFDADGLNDVAVHAADAVTVLIDLRGADFEPRVFSAGTREPHVGVRRLGEMRFGPWRRMDRR